MSASDITLALKLVAFSIGSVIAIVLLLKHFTERR